MTQIPDHDHCWHATNQWLMTDPPKVVDVCCHCGTSRHLPVVIPVRSSAGHGPHFPNPSSPPLSRS